MKNKFLTELNINDIDGEHFRLLNDFVYQDEDGTIYTVPEGFKTDMASIPRGLWNIFPKAGRWDRAAVVHDWLCVQKTMPSPEVHALFKRALQACGVGKIKRNLMWSAVRIFGPRF